MLTFLLTLSWWTMMSVRVTRPSMVVLIGVLRRYGIEQPYEKLKALTRGQDMSREVIQAFVAGLDIPEAARRALLELCPATYTGNAAAQAQAIE